MIQNLDTQAREILTIFGNTWGKVQEEKDKALDVIIEKLSSTTPGIIFTEWKTMTQLFELFTACGIRREKQITMNRSYSWALDMLKAGNRVCRKGWNGKGMWIVLQTALPDGFYGGIKSLPWIGMKTADDCFVPWLCSQTDALAEDWELAE